MFDLNEVDKVLKDNDILNKYKEYLDLAKQVPDRIPEPNKLQHWVMNIAMGHSMGYSLKELVMGVIDAAIFTYSHTLKECIIIADKEISQDKLNKLSKETQELVIKNNENLKKYANNLKSEVAYKEDSSLESKFAIVSFNNKVDEMSLEQARDLLKSYFKYSLAKDKAYSNLIKKQWGI